MQSSPPHAVDAWPSPSSSQAAASGVSGEGESEAASRSVPWTTVVVEDEHAASEAARATATSEVRMVTI